MGDSIDGSCAPSDLGRVEDSIAGSWVFVISKKLSCALVIPFATNLYVREVGAFTFCVGLASLARCVLPLNQTTIKYKYLTASLKEII